MKGQILEAWFLARGRVHQAHLQKKNEFFSLEMACFNEL